MRRAVISDNNTGGCTRSSSFAVAVEMPGGVRQILLIDPDRLGDHAFVGAPGQKAPQPDLHLGVATDHVTKAWVGVVSDTQDELSDLARVAPLFGIFLDELDEACFLLYWESGGRDHLWRS